MGTIKELYEKITKAKYLTAFTGAGISTLSGIPDFRGKDGLYSNAAASMQVEPEKIFDIQYFKKDPSIYYKAASSLIYGAGSGEEKKPSIVHTVLADLDKKEILKAVITQNIDFLHTKAGCRFVFEVHGSPKIHYCLVCSGVEIPFEKAAEIVRQGNLPLCEKCGKVLKPAITFFGEMLPENEFAQAVSAASKTDLMLVLGTSLTVHPAAAIPQRVLACGGEIIIVNNMPTPLDDMAVMRFEDLKETFEDLKKTMEESFENT
ncbi:MAG: NAD-dependent deacetylase [Treponema sp.]|jgi:NAD-dependent deacetylase|nr:NAD-dependent deacetylase [Treponema sp.]